MSAAEGSAALRRFSLGMLLYPSFALLGMLWAPIMLIGMAALAAYYMFEQTPILPDRGESEAGAGLA